MAKLDAADREEGGAQALPDLDGPMQTARATLMDEQFLKSPRYQEQQWRANRNGAHSDILDFERLFIRHMRKLGIPMFAHNMVRTKDEQAALYVRGVTQAKAGSSPHNHGCAVDIVHGVRAWELTRNEWALIGHLGKELANKRGFKLTWGGDWSFWDPAHWELADWKKVSGYRVTL